MCVCVCVCEREKKRARARERERERERLSSARLNTSNGAHLKRKKRRAYKLYMRKYATTTTLKKCTFKLLLVVVKLVYRRVVPDAARLAP